MMNFFLGVDLGTSSLKIILGDEKGRLLGSSSSSFSITSTQIGYSEQNPKDWLSAFELALTEIIQQFPEIKKSPLTIGLSGQMHTLVLLDSYGEVLRPAILWNDGRTTEEVKELKQLVGDHLLEIEKNIPLEGFTLPKIRWIQKNEPDLWEQTWKFMLPKDYLVYSLTGNAYTELSDGAGTIMVDIQNHCWDEALLNKLSIPLDKCPEIKASTTIIGEMKDELKEEYGLTGTVSFVLGGADNACGAFATISDRQTQGLISVGTSGVVLAYTDAEEPKNLGKYHYFNSVIENVHYKMGVTLSAGYSLDWFKKILSPTESFENFTKTAEESMIGSHGISFLPYLFGERSPYFDTNMTGSLIGLRAHHKKEDIVRAIMEGIAFSLKNVYENMGYGQTSRIKTFRMTGGVTKNPFWSQMFADIFQAKIEILAFDEGPAYGALLCAVSGMQDEEIIESWIDTNYVKYTYIPTKEGKKYEIPYQRFIQFSRQQLTNH